MVRISWLTCVFLLLLRLAIGWHFFFEGLYKIRSQHQGTKPFSSQGYFNEAQGPLGPIIRDEIGDPDLLIKAKLQLRDGSTPAEQIPIPIGLEWDDYLERFLAHFKLRPDQPDAEAQARKKLEQAKADFIQWRTFSPAPNDDEKTRKKWKIVKKDIPYVGSVDMPQNIPRDVAEYEEVLRKIRDIYATANPALGRDVSTTQLRELKSQAAKMRDRFQKDIDELTSKMKDSLAKVLDSRSVGFAVSVPADDPTYDDQLLRFVTLDADPDKPMPKALDRQWTDYLGFVQDYGKPENGRDAGQLETILNESRQQYIRYLKGLDEYTGEPRESDVADRLKAYQRATEKIIEAQQTLQAKPGEENGKKLAAALASAKPLRDSFVADIRRFTEILKHNLGGFSDENWKGWVQDAKPERKFLGITLPASKLQYLDTVTPWTLLIAGGCLLAGLFTRLACLTAAAFLVIEYLSQGAFPWLPKSPMTEGNYLFVNKNVIELLALLALATTASGKWLGLDALVSRIWPFRNKRNAIAASRSSARGDISFNHG